MKTPKGYGSNWEVQGDDKPERQWKNKAEIRMKNIDK
jgi:hypothetical protein